jgi:hypothetical protein
VPIGTLPAMPVCYQSAAETVSRAIRPFRKEIFHDDDIHEIAIPGQTAPRAAGSSDEGE